MGKRGPKRTPTAILKIRGSRRATERPDRGTVAEMPEAPAWLTGAALEMWNELSPLLFNANVLTMRDRNALARYCKLWEQWRKATDFVDKYGTTYPSTDANGNTIFRRHTQAIEARNLATILARLEAAFGLEPSARASVGVGAESRPSSLAAFKRSG
jgi:P27 family predicted phage terminase small subunit